MEGRGGEDDGRNGMGQARGWRGKLEGQARVGNNQDWAGVRNGELLGLAW